MRPRTDGGTKRSPTESTENHPQSHTERETRGPTKTFTERVLVREGGVERVVVSQYEAEMSCTRGMGAGVKYGN